MKKVLVQFDGSNFYNKVKKLLPSTHLTNFDYAGLAKSIIGDEQPNVSYYVGEIRKYPGNKNPKVFTRTNNLSF